ncbi:SHOCT domain-containing protein [Paeniglutamicibacter gangotriensis]|uniref:SHOCT domain-containing protein n=1 Tax=Paeniglutamicibacter gangotriensis TaxID=254787 RepID=UPI0037C8218B
MNTHDAHPKPNVLVNVLGWAGTLFTVLGLFLLLKPIDNCGSVLFRDLGSAVFIDSISGRSTETLSCVRNLEAATAPAWLFFCLGIVTILVAIIVKVMTKPELIKPDWDAPKKDRPSFVVELERLAALKAAGAITAEEFESSKAVLLSRAK